MTTTHAIDLLLQNLPPEVHLGHCLPGLVKNFLSIAALVDAGFKVFFHCTGCKVTFNGAIILPGWRDPKNKLWRVKIVDDGWTTDYKVAIPMQEKTNSQANHPTHRTCLQPLQMFHHTQAHALLLRVPELPCFIHIDQGHQGGVPLRVAGSYRGACTKTHQRLSGVQTGAHESGPPRPMVHAAHISDRTHCPPIGLS